VVEKLQLSPSDTPKSDYVTDRSFEQGNTSIGCYKNKLKCYYWIKQKQCSVKTCGISSLCCNFGNPVSFVQVTALPTNAWANENTPTHWLILSRWHAYPDIDQSHHVPNKVQYKVDNCLFHQLHIKPYNVTV